MSSSITNIALRGSQILLAILILALSGNLVATQAFGGAPSSTNYNVFLGIWILVTAALGLATGVLSVITPVVMTVLDALVVVFTFAGGVTYASHLGAHSCSCRDANQSCPYLIHNSIISGGVNRDGQVNLSTDRVGRCRMAQADTAFIWFAWAGFCG